MNINNLNSLDTPLLIAYENDMKNSNSQILELTLQNNKWEYKFIGNNTKWINTIDKVKGFYEYLCTIHPEKIVILSDSRDVICCRSPKNFINDYNSISNNKILFSTEIFLQGATDWETNDTYTLGVPLDNIWKNNNWITNHVSEQYELLQGIPLYNYWKYLNIENINIPNRKYVNSGLIAGKACMLKDAVKWIIDNDYTDDQLGFSNYINKYPEFVCLDTNATILHTSGFGVYGGLYNTSVQNNDSPTFAELFGRTSYFLHIPGQNLKGQYVIYKTITNLVLYGIGDDILKKDYNFIEI
jgi:hypothetical protein